MKLSILASIALAYLAAAAPQLDVELDARCPGVANSTCTPGGATYPPGYTYTSYCGRKVNVTNGIFESTSSQITFQDCVSGCSADATCCAVNYKKCGGVCTFYNNANQDCTVVTYTEAKNKKYNSATLVTTNNAKKM